MKYLDAELAASANDPQRPDVQWRGEAEAILILYESPGEIEDRFKDIVKTIELSPGQGLLTEITESKSDNPEVTFKDVVADIERSPFAEHDQRIEVHMGKGSSTSDGLRKSIPEPVRIKVPGKSQGLTPRKTA